MCKKTGKGLGFQGKGVIAKCGLQMRVGAMEAQMINLLACLSCIRYVSVGSVHTR